MKTLIKNGNIVTATDTYTADIFIDGDRVTMIGTNLPVQADKTIDATGKFVIPGGIDVHTHLDMPFMGASSVDDFQTGTIAAAFGGTTSIVDFAIQERGSSLRKAWETWMARPRARPSSTTAST